MTKWPPFRAESYPRSTLHKLPAIMCVYVEANSASSRFSFVKNKYIGRPAWEYELCRRKRRKALL
jgi:hypothetical protein